jgi:hypothetical protein
MKRKSKILVASAIVFLALLVALFLARKQFVGGPGSPTVEGSHAVTDGGIKIPGWNGYRARIWTRAVQNDRTAG